MTIKVEKDVKPRETGVFEHVQLLITGLGEILKEQRRRRKLDNLASPSTPTLESKSQD